MRGRFNLRRRCVRPICRDALQRLQFRAGEFCRIKFPMVSLDPIKVRSGAPFERMIALWLAPSRSKRMRNLFRTLKLMGDVGQDAG